jgi:hypothetical protein
MILRKLATSLRAQDWFTVALEILIVVVGIFIGLQVDEWNKGRLEDQRAHQALEDLQAEFVTINDVATDLARYYKDIIVDLQILISNLKAGEINPEDEAAIRNAIASGNNFGDPPPPAGTYLDLVSSGSLALIRDKDLRLRLIEYDQGLGIIIQSDLAISNVLGNFGFAFKRHAKFSEAFHLAESVDLSFLNVSHLAVASVNYEAMLADPDFRVAADQHLKSQISRYINIKVSKSKIDQIQDLIDQNLGASAITTESSP